MVATRSVVSPCEQLFPEAFRFCALLTLLVYALAAPLSALDPNKAIHQFTHTSWSVKDGIPGPVLAIAQTPDGYLWLGTHAGMYRFDGQNFVLWQAQADGKFPRSAVSALLTARDGSLWIGFESSVICHHQRGILKTYTPAEGFHTGGTLSIVEDLQGAIWAGGASGFSRFVNGSWRRVGAELGYRAPGARQLLVDRSGTLWVATDGFNFGFNRDSIRVNTILKLPANGNGFEATGQPVGYVTQLAEAPGGEVWMAEASGPKPTVRAVQGHSGPNIEHAVQTGPLCILFDGQAGLWIGLLPGGVRRAPDFRRLEQISFDRFGSKDGLSSDSVRVAMKDREGNIWFGTNGGVDRFRENKVMPLSVKEGLSPNPQVALESTGDQRVWMVHYPLDLLQHFFAGRIVSQTLPRYSRLDSTRILSSYADMDRLWLGGSFGLVDGTNGKFPYMRVPDAAVGTTIEAITSDSSGNLWLVVWEGDRSSVKRLRNGTWTDFRSSPGLAHSRCRVIFADTLKRVWFGFESGEVAIFDNGEFRRYGASDGLPAGRVLSISEDRAGHVWLGGEGGLTQFDGRRFITLTKDNGLPGSSVSAVLEDRNGFLWIAGDLGIFRVSPQEAQNALNSSSYRMRGLLLDATDGLPGLPRQEEPFPTATKAADGRLWFATTDGIAIVDPDRLPMNRVPPPVVIQTVSADNRQFAISPELHFGPKVRNLEIGFAALSLSTPERVRCRYKLEGYDTDWHGPVETRLAAYTNLPPRHYRFRVVGCNDDGLWNEAGAALGFDIAPMFYETNWFRQLCVVSGVFLLWMIYRWRLGLATARLDLRHAERLSERERIARELHDTLLQSFQGLMLRFQVVQNMLPEQPTRAKKSLELAMDRATEAITEGREAVQALRGAAVDRTDLAQDLASLGRELGTDYSGMESGIAVASFRVLVEGTVRPIPPTLRDDIYRIVREAARNAFRHARASRIEVDLRYDSRMLRLRIRDDGIGIDSDFLAAGGREGHWGLPGMRERAESIGGRLHLWSDVSRGTEVELTIPATVAYQKTVARRAVRRTKGKRKTDEIRPQ